jgi:hypothetical protein
VTNRTFRGRLSSVSALIEGGVIGLVREMVPVAGGLPDLGRRAFKASHTIVIARAVPPFEPSIF